MASKLGTIYKITTPSNKVYIGQTMYLKARLRNYRNLTCNKQKLIYHSLCKYGYDALKIEVIEEIPSCLLNERERYWIEFYKSNIYKYPQGNGLNLSNGGDVGKVRKMPEQSNANLSIRMKKLWANPEYRKMQSDAHKGLPSPNKGKPMSEEQKKKMQRPGKPLSIEGRIKLGIRSTGNQHALGYKHTDEARKKISDAGRNRIITDEFRSKISKAKIGNTYTKGLKKSDEFCRNLGLRKSKIVFDTATGIYYDNTIEAAPIVGMNVAALRSQLNGINHNHTTLIYA